MSLSSSIKFFKSDAQAHFSTAAELFEWHCDRMNQAHFSHGFHAASIMYPICHALKALISVGRLILSIPILIGSLFVHPVNNTPKVLTGIALECIALALNALNAAAACVLFITRTAATLFNCSYTEDKKITSPADENVDINTGNSLLFHIEEHLFNRTTNLGL